MDLFDSGPDSEEIRRLASLRETCHQLRTLFHCLAFALLILTGTFFIYLFREVILIKRQSNELTRFVNDYDQSNSRAVMRDFQSKLYTYSQDHSDFRPIYQKYFGTNEVVGGTSLTNSNSQTLPAVGGEK
ncbi:MAG: hypothetical protein ACO1QB_11485 [Verrucomicrobiales bacterium]